MGPCLAREGVGGSIEKWRQWLQRKWMDGATDSAKESRPPGATSVYNKNQKELTVININKSSVKKLLLFIVSNYNFVS